MRLCFIANPNAIHVQRWARFFLDRGHDVHVICVARPTKGMPEGVATYDLAKGFNPKGLRYIPWAWRTRRLLGRIAPDILHCHQITSTSWLGAASGFHPLVVTAWGSDLLVATRGSRMRRHLARWVMGRADYVTCVTRELADICLALGATEDRTEVAPWGVDTTVFHPRKGEKTPGEVRILSIRAMRPLYNPIDIARAIPRVARDHPEARFTIRTYGCDPATLASFRDIVQEAGVNQRVEYVGELPDDTAIADLYRQADIAVSVPSSDGNPLSVIEALACGCVPVLSDLTSLHEWVTEGQEGLYVPQGDVDAIAEAIGALIEKEGVRNEMREAGIQLVREKADARIWMGHVEEIYASLLESS